MLDGEDAIVLVKSIQVHGVDADQQDFSAIVEVCVEERFDAHLDCAVLTLFDDHRLQSVPLCDIRHPAHVVPCCIGQGGGGCHVEARFRLPSDFTPCFALQGTHTQSNMYALNPYFMK